MNAGASITAAVAKPRSRSWIPLIVGAALIVIAPHVFGLFNITPPGLSENRVLAQWPKAPSGVLGIREATKGLENYIQDHFPPRAHLISALSLARYNLGYSGFGRVVVGRDGWLFYNDGSNFGLYRGKRRLSQDEQAAWTSGFKERAEWLRDRNAKFYMLIAPQKQSVYPEKMPRWLPPAGKTEINDILNASRRNGIDQVIYPLDALKAVKSQAAVYGPFDTHWTGLGAYVGYVSLMNRLAVDDARFRPLLLSSFTPKQLPPLAVARDLALMLGIAESVQHDRVNFVDFPMFDENRTVYLTSRKDFAAPVIVETDSENPQTLLLIRDSFSTDLLPFLKKHFRRIIFVHSQEGFFRKDLVEQYRPEVVVLEMVESGARHTMRPLQ
jgi:hypothetical protein